jgi:hypothetical protein
LKVLLQAGKVKWEDFAQRCQIVRLGQLPNASFEGAKGWLTEELKKKAKK